VMAELNWTPKMNVEMAVKFTLDWYRSFMDDSSTISDFTLGQINDFLK
jgi:hypothetical protein